MALETISFGGTKCRDAVNITYAYIKIGNLFIIYMLQLKQLCLINSIFLYLPKHMTLKYHHKVTHLQVGASGCCVMPVYMYIQWNRLQTCLFSTKSYLLNEKCKFPFLNKVNGNSQQSVRKPPCGQRKWRWENQ